MTTGALGPACLRFGLPLALGMAFHGLFNVVDLVIVGHLGAGAVAAVTAAGLVHMAVLLLFNGFIDLQAAALGRLLGRNRRAAAVRVAEEAFTVGWIASLAVGVLLSVPAAWLVEGLIHDSSATVEGARYLSIMAWGSGTMFALLSGTVVFRSFGRSLLPMAVLIAANVLNIVLDLAWVHGLWGAPKMGVAGAAWGTVIARGVGAAVLLFGIGSLPRPRIRWWRMRAPGPATREALARGCVQSLRQVARVAALYLLFRCAAGGLAARDGGSAARDLLDGVGVALRLEMVVVFAALGWGAAAASVVARNLGKGFRNRAEGGVWYCVLGAALMAATAAFALWTWQTSALRLVAPRMTLGALRAGQAYLAWTLPAWALLAAGVVISQGLAGAGSTKTALALDGLLYLALLVPWAYSLSGFEFSPDRLWGGLAGAHFLAAFLYAVVLRWGGWRGKTVAESGFRRTSRSLS